MRERLKDRVIREFLARHPWRTQYHEPGLTCGLCGCLVSSDVAAQDAHILFHEDLKDRFREILPELN